MKNMQVFLLIFFGVFALTGCENKMKIIGHFPDSQKNNETEIIGQSITIEKNNKEVYIYTKEEIKDYLEAKKALYDQTQQKQIYLGRKCEALRKSLPPPRQKAKYVQAKNAAERCEEEYYANFVKIDRIDYEDLPAPSFKTRIDETGFFSVNVPSKKVYVLISPPTSISWINADSDIKYAILLNQIDLVGEYIE